MAVYFAHDADLNHVKIGFSADPEKRLESLRTSRPNLSLMRVCEGTRATERWFHERFASARIQREWFAFNAEMHTVVPPDDVEKVIKIKKDPFALRVSTALREFAPEHGVQAWCEEKAVAVGVSFDTMRSILRADYPPSGATLEKLVSHFGQPFVIALFPEFPLSANTEMAAELARLRDAADEIETAIARAKGRA